MILHMHEFSSFTTLSALRLRALYGNDWESLSQLYAPILGSAALGLYGALYGFASSAKKIKVADFCQQYELSKGDFSGLLSSLEALALIRTYQKENHYTFVLYSPSTPRDFFRNVLLRGLLEEKVGKKESDRLRLSFNPPPLPEGEDVSSGFRNVYGDSSFAHLGNFEKRDSIHSDRAHIRIGMNEATFLEEWEKMMGKSASPSPLFSEQELRDIGRYAVLYGYDEESVAGFVRESFSYAKPFGKRVDFSKLESLCLEKKNFMKRLEERKRGRNIVPGQSDFAKELRIMERSSPVDYLSHLQNGGVPSKADIKIVQYLNKEMGLNAQTINALLSYLASKHDGVISRALAEKIASSLLRANIETALDACDYLKEQDESKKKGEKKEKESVSPSKKEPSILEEKKEEDISEEEAWDILGGK